MLWSHEAKASQLSHVEGKARQRLAEDAKNRSGIGNIVLGGTAGGGLGVLAGAGLSWGAVPGLEMFIASGLLLPLLLGLFLAGAGVIAGSFIDLLPAANGWRNNDA